MTHLTRDQYNDAVNHVDTIRIEKDPDGRPFAQYYPDDNNEANIIMKNIKACLPPRYIEYLDPDEMIQVLISETHRVVSSDGCSYLPSYPIMILPLYKLDNLIYVNMINEKRDDSDYNEPIIVYTRLVMVQDVLMPLCNVTF